METKPSKIKTIITFARGVTLGALAVIALNSAGRVITVNVWPSLPAIGEQE